MLYVQRMIKNVQGEGYPFSVPALAAAKEIRFTAPITVICGDNGSGKSTLLSLLAARRSFFFSAEDFIAYIAWVSRTKAEARAELERIEADDTIADKKYARMPSMRTLEELSGLYAEDLALQSHGEGFLDFFQSRLKPGGVYLLDEPEGALSFEKQYALALDILEGAAHSQFILATHSPVLAAMPGAAILEATARGFLPRKYEELENIQFLRLFLECPQRMFREYL